jgi:hypothetical protein
MVAQVRYSVAGRSRGQVALCAVYTWHMESRTTGFLVEPQNQGRWFVSGLASKPLGWFLIGLASKPMATVCEWFGLKTTRTVFACLASKPVVTVSGGLALKAAVTVFAGLASKPMATVSGGLGSKPAAMVFAGLALKLVAMVSPILVSKPVVGFLVEP